jgi:hypothetical protein
VKHGAAYARFLYNPTMLDVLVRNLHLPLHPLGLIEHQSNLGPVIAAWDAILDYLKINPGYFTYRFGMEEGLATQSAIKELRQLAVWVQENGYTLTLKPLHIYRNLNTGAEVTESGGCFPRSMRASM